MTDEFKLSGYFSFLSYHVTSDTYKLDDIEWMFSVSSKDRQVLNVLIHNSNSSNLQSFDTNIKINLKYDNGTNLEKTFDVKFDYKNNTHCIDFVSIEEFEKHQNYFHPFTMNVVMKVSKIAPIRKTTDEIDLCEKDSVFNDIVLQFENSKVLYSSKAMLSIHSKVFNTMFNSNFEEKYQTKIKLDDDFEEFKTMLMIIYPSKNVVNSKNIEILMKLADKYDMSQLMDKCVAFVEKDGNVQNDLRLLLADRYNLPKVHNKCIRNFKDMESLEKFEESEVFGNLTQTTQVAVLKRAFGLSSQEKKDGGPMAKIKRAQEKGFN